MNAWITRNNCSAVRPVAFLPYQFIAHRIGERVEAKTREGVAPSFLFAQDVIVRLMLPLATATQGRFKMRARKFHGVELIALAAQAHPDEMQMIGHETVGGAEKLFARGGVEHQFAKHGVERRREPTPRPFFQRVRPEDNGVTLVMMPSQSWKLPFVRRDHAAYMEISAVDVNISVKPVAAVAADVRRRTRLLAGGLNLGVKIRLLTSAATRLDDPVHQLMVVPGDAGLYHFTVGTLGKKSVSPVSPQEWKIIPA